MNKMQTIHPWLVWRRKILMTMKLGVAFCCVQCFRCRPVSLHKMKE